MIDFFPPDELDQTLANAGTAPRVASVPNGYISPVEMFSEGCRKCHGRGYWRPGYPCFACKGKGKLSYRTSPQARAANAASRDARKARTEQEALASFAATYPDIWQWMDGSTFTFAVSLRDAIARYGSLTEGQLNAARNCLEKRNAAIASRQSAAVAAPAIDISKIETAFASASASGLKRLKLRIAGFAFAPAPTNGRNAGAIYVKRGTDYLGKVQGGKLVCLSHVDTETRAKVVTIASDPEQAAVAHGMQTGTCSCCGAELTNKESIARGIGPICASRYGW